MNTFNTTLVSPAWAIESELDDDGRAFVHRGEELSTDDQISVHIERYDSLSDSNEYEPVGHSLCVFVQSNGKFPSSGSIQLDIDEESTGDPSTVARRLAAQLLLAADRLEAVR
jgi:hypothetical protein